MTCTYCKGFGTHHGGAPCHRCGGSGRLDEPTTKGQCGHCQGRGRRLLGATCVYCNGTGTAQRKGLTCAVTVTVDAATKEALALTNTVLTRLRQAEETRDAAQAEATKQTLLARQWEQAAAEQQALAQAAHRGIDRAVEELQKMRELVNFEREAHALTTRRWRAEVDDLVERLNKYSAR
jgi:hypothetical protein